MPGVALLAELRWPILERIPVVGDLAVSPHGISIAAGFLLGAQVMLRRVQRRGLARRHVGDNPEAVVQAILVRAVLGTIVGARFFYVVTRLEEFPSPLQWFTVWEGGLSLLGGITGAILAGIPYVLRRGYSIPLLLDSVAPALAVGIFVGRIGDLVIGEHLGGRTDFPLGWRCTGAYGDPAAPHPWPGPQVQGCYDATLHQTALYDFLAAGAVLAVLVLLERRPRFDGFFFVAFALLYGTGRFLSDFAREADKDLLGTLTGTQLAALAAVVGALGWVAATRPDRRTPYAWDPPDFDHPWAGARGGDDGRRAPS
ncbi:MAG: prolipoprotein diacylglyceryl transferase [Actinomycetota bacterium]|nr:prolipoprotein diacylglyceryl transferase [Actinomycetota bacterium]